jgi:hypothetical protein
MPTGPDHLLGTASRAGSDRQHAYPVFGLYTVDLRDSGANGGSRWVRVVSLRELMTMMSKLKRLHNLFDERHVDREIILL